jgi:hypothetical protein
MDWQPLHGLSGIQAPTWGVGRIQRKVYVGSGGFARGLLCHTSGSRARSLSELLSTCNAFAIHGNTPGGLMALAGLAAVTKLATNSRQCWTSVARPSAAD